MVARNKGPSSVALKSSPGRWHETSTLIWSFDCDWESPGAGSDDGRFGDDGSSYKGNSAPLRRESTDCDDGTRSFGGAAKLKVGEGEFGWLKCC